MTVVKKFEPEVSVEEAMRIICSNADDLIKDWVIGTFGATVLVPKTGLNLSTVTGITVGDKTTDGYMISVTPAEDTTKESHEEVCEPAIIQRFIGVDESGRAVKLAPAGRSVHNFISV